MEHASCPVCNQPSPLLFGREALSIWYCEACCLGFQWPAAKTVYETNYRPDIPPHEEIYYKKPRTRIAFAKDVIGDGAGRKVLDIGCAAGHNLKVFHDLGFEMHGIEPEFTFAEAAEKFGVRVFRGYLEDYNLGERFDIITLFHVFEHINPPMLAKVSALLKEDGFLVVEVPNLSDTNQHTKTFFCTPHLFYHTIASLVKIFGKYDFTPVKWRGDKVNLIVFKRGASEAGFAEPHQAKLGSGEPSKSELADIPKYRLGQIKGRILLNNIIYNTFMNHELKLWLGGLAHKVLGKKAVHGVLNKIESR